MPESRVKKTLLNARVNLIFYFLTLCLSFFSRKIFLDCLGAGFVGLTGTLQNLLGFLNLAELGIGSAIGYLLYKPLFDHDQEKINEIISVMGYLYRWIGFVIFGAGCILACFLPLIFPDSGTGFHMSLIYFAYFAFLGSSLIGYFINYRQNLLGADQRNYVVTAYFQTTNIVKICIQMALAYFYSNYYIWVFIEFTFGILYSFILNWRINNTYPWLKADVKLGKKLFRKYPEVFKYTRQLFVHRISSFVQFQTTPFLIYSFVNLTTVAFYQNYMTIIDKLFSLIGNFVGSTGAGVGNLIAEGNKKRIMDVYWELFTIQFVTAASTTFLLYVLINPFLGLWLGKRYIMSGGIVGLILIRYFISQTRSITDQFLFGYGLFYDTWAPIAECVIFVAFAIVGGSLYGLAGVLSGGVFSLLCIVWGWKPFFLFWKGFKISVFKYWGNIFIYYSIGVCSALVTLFLLSKLTFLNLHESFITWTIYALFAGVIYIIFSRNAIYFYSGYETCNIKIQRLYALTAKM